MTSHHEAVPSRTGSDAEPVIARLRQHLADDLDTPKALAAVDGWCADVRNGIGSSTTAPAELAAAVDALLGIPLVPDVR